MTVIVNNMCAGNCGGCSDCSQITLEQIAGPIGPQGPSGTTVIYWNTNTLTSTTTGSDVLLDTFVLPANSLATNGDELEIEITGAWLNSAIRSVKLELNNPPVVIAQSGGSVINGVFTINSVITRVSNTTTEGYSHASWNSGAANTTFVSNSFTTNFSTNQNIKIYINQDTASSVRIDSIKIKKALV